MDSVGLKSIVWQCQRKPMPTANLSLQPWCMCHLLGPLLLVGWFFFLNFGLNSILYHVMAEASWGTGSLKNVKMILFAFICCDGIVSTGRDEIAVQVVLFLDHSTHIPLILTMLNLPGESTKKTE